MQAQWCLVDRSRPKRSNEEDIGISSKRQRRVRSELESSDECGDVPRIRGGGGRPRPPQLGRPPSRATNTASQANKTTSTANTVPTPTAPSRAFRIIDSDDDDDDDESWRPQRIQPANTNQPATTGAVVNTTGVPTTTGQPPPKAGIQGTTNPPNQPPQVGKTTTPLPPAPVQQQLPTPPKTGPSNEKQGAVTGAGTGTGGPGGTSSTTTPTRPPPSFSQEAEILALYSRLQAMVVTWVEECLPDTFPPDFQTERPERYWELCGWCRPLKLGDSMLSDRSWAKYVYESWVWRFLYQEILRPGSITWAGNDTPLERGGAGAIGRATNSNFGKKFDASWRAEYPRLS